MVQSMSPASHFRRARLLASLSACLLTAVVAPAVAASATSSEAAMMKALLRSRELWATIDVCNPHDQPDYVGIRGSMPGDKRPHDSMYMSFRLQYMEKSHKRWVDLVSGSSPSFVYVGHAGSVRQGGRSFQLVPRPGKPAVTLRGVVDYQWRRGATVLQSISRPTTAGHTSLAGADPAELQQR